MTEITLSEQVENTASAARKREILAEAEAAGVKFLRLQFTDILGVIKNVEVPDRQFAADPAQEFYRFGGWSNLTYCGAGSYPCGSIAGTPGYMAATQLNRRLAAL